MKPYYEQSGVTIYHGDCREVLADMSDASVRMILADPPYNSGLSYGGGTDDNRPDYWGWLDERVSQMLRVGDVVLVKHSALKLPEFSARWRGRVLVWVKPFSSGYPLNGVATHWEPIHWLKGKSVAWSKDYFECSAGSRGEVTTGHPAQYPEPVAHWLLSTFTSQGDTVLDAFAGSGTTLVAAKRLGRRAIGIEIEERWCEVAVKRLQQEALPLEVA